MDLIELFKRLFLSLEMSGLAHFPIIIDIISSSKVLPKCIASCIFSGVNFCLIQANISETLCAMTNASMNTHIQRHV